MQSPRRAAPPLPLQRTTTGSAGRCTCCAIVGDQGASGITGLHHWRRCASDPVRPALAAPDPVGGPPCSITAATCQKRSAASFSSGGRPPPTQWISQYSCAPQMRARSNSSAYQVGPGQHEIVGGALRGGPVRWADKRCPLRPSCCARSAHVENEEMRRRCRRRALKTARWHANRGNGPPLRRSGACQMT